MLGDGQCLTKPQLHAETMQECQLAVPALWASCVGWSPAAQLIVAQLIVAQFVVAQFVVAQFIVAQFVVAQFIVEWVIDVSLFWKLQTDVFSRIGSLLTRAWNIGKGFDDPATERLRHDVSQSCHRD